MTQILQVTTRVASTREDLILSCQAPVSRLARRYAQGTHALSFDDLYMTGMTEVCEWAERASACATNPIGYLTRAAQHAMVDELRRMHRERSHVSLDAPLSREEAWCLSDVLATPVAFSDVASEPVRALRQALLRLSPRQRSVLTRLYECSGGNRHAEVGRELGISRSSASYHAIRGRQRLRADPALCEAVGVVPEATALLEKGHIQTRCSAQYALEEDYEEQADFPLLLGEDEEPASLVDVAPGNAPPLDPLMQAIVEHTTWS